jgi:predicted  nucleic acid-binding Zn-ribbon protein
MKMPANAFMNEPMQNLLKLQTLEFDGSKNKVAAAAIAELRGKIPPQILGHYDRLVVRGKKGMAQVRNQVCTGCHMFLPIGVIAVLKRGQDLQLCDSCGRYLYLLEEGQAAAPEPPPAPAKPATAKKRKRKSLAKDV